MRMNVFYHQKYNNPCRTRTYGLRTLARSRNRR